MCIGQIIRSPNRVPIRIYDTPFAKKNGVFLSGIISPEMVKDLAVRHGLVSSVLHPAKAQLLSHLIEENVVTSKRKREADLQVGEICIICTLPRRLIINRKPFEFDKLVKKCKFELIVRIE